ncbi:hypothetical protein D3C75_663850 [compost metagenome]
MTDEVNSRGRDVGAAGHPQTGHLRTEIAIREDHAARHDAIFDNVLLMIDIVYEQIQGCNPLSNPGFQPLPFHFGNNPRNHIKGNRTLHRMVLCRIVQRKGNSLFHHPTLHHFLFELQLFGAHPGKHAVHMFVMRPDTPFISIHFIVKMLQWIRRQSGQRIKFGHEPDSFRINIMCHVC